MGILVRSLKAGGQARCSGAPQPTRRLPRAIKSRRRHHWPRQPRSTSTQGRRTQSPVSPTSVGTLTRRDHAPRPIPFDLRRREAGLLYRDLGPQVIGAVHAAEGAWSDAAWRAVANRRASTTCPTVLCSESAISATVGAHALPASPPSFFSFRSADASLRLRVCSAFWAGESPVRVAFSRSRSSRFSRRRSFAVCLSAKEFSLPE